MKTIFLVCLLGMSLMSAQISVKANPAIAPLLHKRIVDVTLESQVLFATSDESSGAITDVMIYDSDGHKLISQSCGGYSCSVDVSKLHAGYYSAHVITTTGTYIEYFTLT